MAAKKHIATACLIGVMLVGTIAPAQTNSKLALSVQGGINVFYGNAYPNDITNYSYSSSLDWRVFPWGGLMAKFEKGTLTGTNEFKSGEVLFSSKVEYNLYALYGYLNLSNLILDLNNSHRMDILAFAGTGLLQSHYSYPYINKEALNRYTYGTESNPENMFPVIGGIILEYAISPKIKILAELCGFIEYTDRLDGVAYGAVHEDELLYFEPDKWQLVSYKEEYEKTGEHPQPKKLSGFDNFLTLQIGIKYSFGKSETKKRSTTIDNTLNENTSFQPRFKELPRSYLKFEGPY